MKRVRAALNAYFHAPNLLKARPLALKLRGTLHALWRGEEPLLVLKEDVLRFHPKLHRRLAQLSLELGAQRRRVYHLEEVLAVEGESKALLEALALSWEVLGELEQSQRLRTRLKALPARP